MLFGVVYDGKKWKTGYEAKMRSNDFYESAEN
jgi:hypothetical protein